jgi:two-component system response regulator RegA
MLACGGESERHLATVLVVDDSQVARHALAKRLVADGHTVVELDSMRTGSAASLEGIACAVLDLELGDGDGVEVAEALRSRSATLPIAFFTGAPTSALATSATAHGPVFAKPGDLDRVAEWVLLAVAP